MGMLREVSKAYMSRKPMLVLLVKGNEIENSSVQRDNIEEIRCIWYNMLHLLEAQYITLTLTYQDCFGNVQYRYRSLEWNQRYQSHAKRKRVLSKGCEYKY